MSEQFTSSQEEQNAATRTPGEMAEKFKAGVDSMTGELKANRAFYGRMAGVAAVRNILRVEHSNEVYAAARQLYGPLGYDTGDRHIRKM